MKTEIVLSTCILAALSIFAIGAIEASSFPIQVILTGLAVALFFYHVTRRNIGFSVDAALAQKSLVVGLLTAIPVATLVG